MKSSCVRHPENESLLIMRKWQVDATGDHCSAALLSFFEYWHSIKIEMRVRASAANKIAVAHGDEAAQDTSLFQFHTAEELSAGIMGLYNRDRIRKGIKKLVELGFLSVHRNPNPRYRFDNTHHFLFHPGEVNQWLVENEFQRTSAKNRMRSAKISQRSSNNRTTIPETTSETSSEISNTKGISNEMPRSYSPKFKYPETEQEMEQTLESHGIEPNPDYDGRFFETFNANGWKIHGKPIFDWIETYRARLKTTSPTGV